MIDLTILILTRNEALHIERCLTRLQPLGARICVLDSGSDDTTAALARALGAEVLVHPFDSHSRQLNRAKQLFSINTTWTLRIDADEYPDDILIAAILGFLARPDKATCAELRRQVVFMGQPIRHGFFYPLLTVRLWKTALGQFEDRQMDEHLIITPATCIQLPGTLIDENLNTLGWWINKHTHYATKEAEDHLANPAPELTGKLVGRARRFRWMKTQIYYVAPPGLRAVLYFLYRYIIGLGFLDGRGGFYFHLFQGLWYRVLVDAKIDEMRRALPIRSEPSARDIHHKLRNDITPPASEPTT